MPESRIQNPDGEVSLFFMLWSLESGVWNLGWEKTKSAARFRRLRSFVLGEFGGREFQARRRRSTRAAVPSTPRSAELGSGTACCCQLMA